jgi:hypothetical protein
VKDAQLTLYATEDGRRITTHSMLKCMSQCPRQTLYKYHDRLKPRVQPNALKRGVWIHELLEAFYKGEDWEEVHERNCDAFDQLFDEEKDKLDDLPVILDRLMRSYLWHYEDDADWEVLEIESSLDVEFPGLEGIYRCRVDCLVETPYGIYIVDHKSHRVLPDLSFRLRDAQSALYIWAYRKAGIPVQGFIWNYLRYVEPKAVKFNMNGSMSKRQGVTDYPTAYKSIKSQGHDPKEFRDFLLPLRRQRYKHGYPQTSPFFQRSVIEKSDVLLDNVLETARHTAQRMHEYPFDDRQRVERNVGRHCDWCSYKDLCTTELFGGNVDLAKRSFKVGDPLDYYKDEKEIVSNV